MINGGVSWWWRDIGGTPAARAPLPGDLALDVCIVGAGYTGLWTAYYLKLAQPDTVGTRQSLSSERSTTRWTR